METEYNFKTELLAMNKQEKDAIECPATESLAYCVMKPRWKKIDTLLAGTEAMREAGKKYLPQHAEEADKTYAERLASTVLLNVTEQTLDSWVGRPFSEPVGYSKDFPEELKELLKDTDLQGNNLDVFARNWFREGVAKAFAHVLVDMPRIVDKLDDKGEVIPRTLKDDVDENIRPYCVLVKPENLIFAHGEVVDGVEVLTHIRIKEEIVEQVGFAEVVRQQIRVIELKEDGTGCRQQIWVLVKDRKKKEEWKLKETFDYDIDAIPLVTFYATRDGLMLGKPPLTDLADLNISHWQSSSDQRAVLTVARFPILAVSGIDGDEGKGLTVGPNNFLSTENPQGKFYYVEHTGKAIAAGRQDLQDLQDQMADYGAEVMKKRVSGTTATESVLDNAAATSPLQDMVLRFEDALNQVKYFMRKWTGEEDAGSFEVHRDFGANEVTSADVSSLIEARKNRDISRVTFLKEMQRRGMLDEDVDFDEDSEELEKELMSINGEAQTDLDPDQEDVEELEEESNNGSEGETG